MKSRKVMMEGSGLVEVENGPNYVVRGLTREKKTEDADKSCFDGLTMTISYSV